MYYIFNYSSPKLLITITTGLEKFIANCGLLNASSAKNRHPGFDKKQKLFRSKSFQGFLELL